MKIISFFAIIHRSKCFTAVYHLMVMLKIPSLGECDDK